MTENTEFDAHCDIGIDDVVSCLSAGWTLENRGTGWWLAAPRKPYQRTESALIPDDIVESMEHDGLIKIEIPYTAAKAILSA